jgi:hypothetical protein
MPTDAAKRALAALLLNTPTTSKGAVTVESLFARLRDEGHKEPDLEAGLFALKTEELIRVEVSAPERSILHDIPDDVFLTPPPKPEPTSYTYRVARPLPALQEWWERQSGKPGSTEGDFAQTNHRYTLGELIRELESAESAFIANSRTADRVEAEHGSIPATWWRVQAAALRFQPDPIRMPGIDRIQVLCDELAGGTGLTAANVRQLRARLCRLKGRTLQDADNCSLVEAADALEAATVTLPELATPPRRPADPSRYGVTAKAESEARGSVIDTTPYCVAPDRQRIDQAKAAIPAALSGMHNEGGRNSARCTIQSCQRRESHPPARTGRAPSRRCPVGRTRAMPRRRPDRGRRLGAQRGRRPQRTARPPTAKVYARQHAGCNQLR